MSVSRFINVPPEKPFHSNQYAETARPGRIGSTNSQSFEQRHQVERSRLAVKQYRDSLVAWGGRRHDSRSPVRRDANEVVTPRTITPQRIAPLPRMAFTEPTSRRYNPFG